MAPGITESRSAAAGTGILRYYEDLDRPTSSPGLEFTFEDRPWRPHEYPPFSWQHLESYGPKGAPVLRLAVSRGTAIEIRPLNPIVGTINPFAPNERDPEIQIIRTQYRPRRIPLFDEPIGAFEIHPPVTLGPDWSNRRVSKGFDGRMTWNDTIIAAKQMGVTTTPYLSRLHKRGEPVRTTSLMHLGGGYSVEIYIKDPWRPARYWYWYATDPADGALRVRIVVLHDENVLVKSIRSRLGRTASGGPVPELATYARTIHDFDPFDIPFQDEQLLPEGSEWILDAFSTRASAMHNEAPDGEFLRGLVDRAEGLISLIPVLGEVYDVASFVYGLATGKRMWVGDKLSPIEQGINGAAALLPLVPASARVLARAPRPISAEADLVVREATREAIGDAVPVEVVAAVGALPQGEQAALAAELLEVSAGKRSAKVFAGRLFAALSAVSDLSTPLQRRDALRLPLDIDAVLAADLRDFSQREPRLRAGYQATLAKIGGTADDLSPMDWARRHSRGEHADILRRRLGRNFAGIMRFIADGKGNRRPVRVRPAGAATYSRLFLVFDTYAGLKTPVGVHSNILQRDHLIEKRFFMRPADVSQRGGAQMLEQGMCVAVPTTQDIAEQLGGSTMVLYVHDNKSAALRRYLPIGGEGTYTLQNIWDAHVYFYNSLSIDAGNLAAILGHMETDMKVYANLLSDDGAPLAFINRIDPSNPALRPERFAEPSWWLREP